MMALYPDVRHNTMNFMLRVEDCACRPNVTGSVMVPTMGILVCPKPLMGAPLWTKFDLVGQRFRKEFQ